MTMERDPDEAVLPGLDLETPEPDDDQIRDLLEESAPSDAEKTPDQIDADIERESRMVQPHSAAPSRAGIGGSGSGADEEGL